jgi:hypothetical protein
MKMECLLAVSGRGSLAVEYQDDTESVGVKVLIHDQKEPIFIRESGFAVMPGRRALVSVTKKQVCLISVLLQY